jgi:hypothetical protein
MFQLFYTYVASVLSRCCICFKHMLQLFHLNVAMLHIYVTSVSSRCYICFAMATRVFSWCFRRMLPVFQLFRTYVASVSSRCCKSRSGVAHVAIGPIWRSHLLQLLGPCACVWVWRGASGRHGKQCGRADRDMTLYFAANIVVVEMAKVTSWIRRTATTVVSLIQIAIMHVIARGARVGTTAHSARHRMGPPSPNNKHDAVREYYCSACNNGL